jgi:mannose-6-phosphate isomerase-like protein (cupin superfamily)
LGWNFVRLEGVLNVMWTEGQTELTPLEFVVIPKGVARRVVPKGHVKLLLFEPATTEHTGNVRSEITKDKLDRLA